MAIAGSDKMLQSVKQMYIYSVRWSRKWWSMVAEGDAKELTHVIILVGFHRFLFIDRIPRWM